MGRQWSPVSCGRVEFHGWLQSVFWLSVGQPGIPLRLACPPGGRRGARPGLPRCLVLRVLFGDLSVGLGSVGGGGSLVEE